MNRILLLLLLILITSGFAQEKINQKDSQGRKQGVWKQAHDSVRVFRYVGQFKDDIPYGKFVYYYKTGEVQAVVHFSNGGKTTRSQMYHQSGYLMAQGKYLNQEKDSIWVYYDDRGIISYQETYKGGKLNGQKVYFYAPVDNQLRVARYEYYKNGVLDGEFKEYHENTKVKETGNYKDGNLHGVVVSYYPNGKIQKTGNYKYAVKHGLWGFYNEKGELLGTKMYWEGKLCKGADAAAKEQLWKEQMKK